MARDDDDQIDNSTQIVTPENISFQYQAAGPFRRLPAYAIDLAIQTLLLVIILMVGMFTISWFSQGLFAAIVLVSWFALNWFYGGILETFWNGQTVGKRMTGLRVLTVEGEPINGLQAVMRNVFRFADSFPLISLGFLDSSMAMLYIIPTFALGLGAMALNQRFQRIGDLVCGTMVVVEDRHWLTGVVRLEDPRVAQLSELIPLDFAISRTLSKTLAHYVERRRFFSQARRREIAHHIAEPLLSRFNLPSDTSHDLLLCALYHRAFVSERSDDYRDGGMSPFAVSPSGERAEMGSALPPLVGELPRSLARR